MNYPRIFQRVYGTPLMITSEGFRSIDAVLRPRLLGKIEWPDEAKIKLPPSEAAEGRKRRPRATTSTNPAGQTVVTDPRLYGLVGPGVAAVPMKGILARNVGPFEEACMGLAGYEPIAAALLQADAAPEVQDIILDSDSPGGECIGSFELADVIAGLSKTVYGYVEGLGASAAYAELSQCDEVHVTQSSWLGSIGVKGAVLDDSAAMEAAGLKMEYFTAGANKLHTGADGYTLTDADRALNQERVDYYYSLFASYIAAGRGADIEPLVQKSAKLYIGQQAVDAGLADGVVGGFDELVQLILEARTA